MHRSRAAAASWLANVLLPLPCRPDNPTHHGDARVRKRRSSRSSVAATTAESYPGCVVASLRMTIPSTDPLSTALYQEALATFRGLLDEARASGDTEPAAMTLATVDDTRISARVVLLKGVDERGFRFFTNYRSDKGRQLAAHRDAALCFHWKTLREQIQVRIEGAAVELDAAESDAYFATRPRGSQIGAWASLQSQPLRDRAEFEARIAEFEARFDGVPVTRPPHWGGYVVEPRRIEFWYGATYRLHDRHVYTLGASGWTKQLLYP